MKRSNLSLMEQFDLFHQEKEVKKLEHYNKILFLLYLIIQIYIC